MSSTGRGVLTVVRVTWGVALLVAPATVTARVHHAPAGFRTDVVARVLGARHIGQALVTVLRPTRAVRRGGVAVDVAHAASMVALAAVSPAHRRAGLTDAAIGAAFGVASGVVA